MDCVIKLCARTKVPKHGGLILSKCSARASFQMSWHLCASSKPCLMVKAIDKEKDIHDELSREGLLEDDTVLGGPVMHMYVKYAALRPAKYVLEAPFLWHCALKCFDFMICLKWTSPIGSRLFQTNGILWTKVIYACILNACVAIDVSLIESIFSQRGVPPPWVTSREQHTRMVISWFLWRRMLTPSLTWHPMNDKDL